MTLTEHDGHELTQTRLCKMPNCTRESLGPTVGPYAGLCDEHTEASRLRRSAEAREKALATHAARRETNGSGDRDAVRPAEALAEEGFERKAKGLVAVGRRLDVAIRRYRPAKEELDAAIEGWRTICRALAGEEPGP